MNYFNEKILAKKYSSILLGEGYSSGELFGFECGDGWFWIVNGTLDLVGRYSEQHCPELKVTQVKEKFGQLRIYCRGGDENVEQAMDIAELVSGNVCECCGRSGKISDVGGWLQARCDLHNGARLHQDVPIWEESGDAYSAIYAASVSCILGFFRGTALTWVQTPLIAFSGRKPYELLTTKTGCNEVISLVKRLEYGVGV